MRKEFKDALDAGLVEVTILPGGEKMIVDGVTYYNATEDGFNLLMGRFHGFADVLRKHDELKLSDEMLTTGLSSLTGLLKRIRAQANVDTEQVLDAAQEAIVILDRLEQRRTLGPLVEQVFEIASIYHFSEEEDPAAIDSEINRKKIVSWANSAQSSLLYAFFLRSPIGRYMPSRGLFDTNTLNSFREGVIVPEALDWTRTLEILKTTGVSSETMMSIQSRRETLYALDGFLGRLLNAITITVPPGSEANSEK